MLSKNIVFFIKVVECGSFSKAAKELYVSQSAVSQQITKLEEELGVKLFNREGYIPNLTEAGSYYYNKCKKIISLYDSVKEKTKRLEIKNKKNLKIGISDLIDMKYLPQIIEAFKEVRKDISIDFKKVNFEEAAISLEKEDIDISFGIRNEFIEKKHIKSLKLREGKLCIICSNKHYLARENEVDISQIANEGIIIFSDKIGRKSREDYLENFKKDGFRPNIIKEVEDLKELILYVKINKGISLVCKDMVRDEKDIAILNLKNTNHKAEFCIACLKKKYNKEIKEFFDITSDFFGRI